MPVLKSRQETFSTKNTVVKYLLPLEKDIIKNVYGNDNEIPQTIYNYIQNNLNLGKKAYAILKIKFENGNSYWTKNIFEPKINTILNKNSFTIKTELSNIEKIATAKQLYSNLNKIEHSFNSNQASKFLDGYLEEKCITFNEFTSLN